MAESILPLPSPPGNRHRTLGTTLNLHPTRVWYNIVEEFPGRIEGRQGYQKGSFYIEMLGYPLGLIIVSLLWFFVRAYLEIPENTPLFQQGTFMFADSLVTGIGASGALVITLRIIIAAWSLFKS